VYNILCVLQPSCVYGTTAVFVCITAVSVCITAVFVCITAEQEQDAMLEQQKREKELKKKKEEDNNLTLEQTKEQVRVLFVAVEVIVFIPFNMSFQTFKGHFFFCHLQKCVEKMPLDPFLGKINKSRPKFRLCLVCKLNL